MEAGDREPRRRDPGEYIGELQWRDNFGKVVRWPVFQAKRKNQIAISGMIKGWDWLLRRLRHHLVAYMR